MILTLETLKAENACADQLALFRELFGKSVDVTPELCESVADRFAFGWAAQHLLSPSARAEYQRVTAPAWRALAPVWAEYLRVTAPVWYERVEASARAEYLRVTARAFGELFCKETST